MTALCFNGSFLCVMTDSGEFLYNSQIIATEFVWVGMIFKPLVYDHVDEPMAWANLQHFLLESLSHCLVYKSVILGGNLMRKLNKF